MDIIPLIHGAIFFLPGDCEHFCGVVVARVLARQETQGFNPVVVSRTTRRAGDFCLDDLPVYGMDLADVSKVNPHAARDDFFAVDDNVHIGYEVLRGGVLGFRFEYIFVIIFCKKEIPSILTTTFCRVWSGRGLRRKRCCLTLSAPVRIA